MSADRGGAVKPFTYLPRALPPALEPLTGLVTDLRWTWSHESDAIWQTLNPEVWEQTGNPYAALQYTTEERLDELAADSVFTSRLIQLDESRKAYLARGGWYGVRHGNDGLKGIAYFSMEFGIGEALPLYAGGLGILAGDYLKAASDLGVPVTAVGLLYQQGYLRQVLDGSGWQQEVYPYNDPTSLPVFPVKASTGVWLRIPIALPGRTMYCRVWKAQVGRIDLYLLDSNDPLNSAVDRGITGQLYGGGEEMRLVQEITLGIGGWRLIDTLGLEIDICHLNEGHAAFVVLERVRKFMQEHGSDFREGLWATRPGNVFTTHTPVAAGFDAYPEHLIVKYGLHYAAEVNMPVQELLALGRRDPANPAEPFGMAWLAARSCGAINGVSRLHGEISRRIFAGLYPRWPYCEVPVSHVTNGIHAPSWDSSWADEIWTASCGKERWREAPDSLTTALCDTSDEELWELAARQRSGLIQYVRTRLARQLAGHGADAGTVAATQVLDPNVLTLGLARRFTEYKRPCLLLHDPERLIRLLNNPQRPLQLVIAGKAHARDEDGKRCIMRWMRFVQRPEVRDHAVFLEDYDMALAQVMVQGVDVWLNTPRRPLEACGTSGMKVLVNGGLNLSSLDGWWDEAFTPEVGWALGGAREHGPERDSDDAAELCRLLEQEVVPAFYDRDDAGIPRQWTARMRASMARLTPRFSATRMVQDYVERMYIPACAALRKRCAGGKAMCSDLRQWEWLLRQHWHFLHWGRRDAKPDGDGIRVEVQLYLGELSPEFVQVQLYAEGVGQGTAERLEMRRLEPITGALNGFVYGCRLDGSRSAGDYTPRVIPFHPEAHVPAELNLISWYS